MDDELTITLTLSEARALADTPMAGTSTLILERARAKMHEAIQRKLAGVIVADNGKRLPYRGVITTTTQAGQQIEIVGTYRTRQLAAQQATRRVNKHRQNGARSEFVVERNDDGVWVDSGYRSGPQGVPMKDPQ